jgi:ferredoxin/flavodoxin---NADP+ reductase
MKWTPGTVEKKIIWDEGLFTLVVRAPEVQAFEPGQFLQLGITHEGHHVHRPYSVASPHGELLEFFIVLVEDGRLTPHLWRMECGDAIDISYKAAGSFCLSHCPPARSLWMIATGTGLAPYIAMLRTENPWRDYQNIYVVHGVRYGRDLAYKSELGEMRHASGARLHYLPVVSREQLDGPALHGRITTCIDNGSLEAAAGEGFSRDSCVMMCGNPDMLDETEHLLQARGLKRHRSKEPGQIVVERYW